MCDICNQNAAVKICQTCNDFFCEPHARQHGTQLQKHIIKDIGSDIQDRSCLHQKPKDFYCITDHMHICSICVEGNHKRHDITSQEIQVDVGEDLGQHDTVVPPPGEIKFLTVKPNSVALTWGLPPELSGTKKFRVKWSSLIEVEGLLVIKDLNKVEINNLQLGEQYFFSVATEDEGGKLSKWVTACVSTAVPPPRDLTKVCLESTTLSLTWSKGENMEGIQHQFLITITSPDKESFVIYTKDCHKTLSDLESDTEYNISVSTLLNDKTSDPVSISVHTELGLREVLTKIGLEDEYDTKLKISQILQIIQHDTSEINIETPESLTEAFLRRLLMCDTNARSVKCVSSDLEMDKKNAINPLDLIAGLFLCSDKFLQQNMVGKMVQCQFAVPLLLPNIETRELTMMLWSMREIVRNFTPLQQAFRGTGSEERLVFSEMPLVSFVRLGKHFLSKSQMLNKLLSNTEQYHDIFYHSALECGDVPRRISEGLVEFSWYLPCGNRSVDKFSEPMAVANLRGDIRSFDKQFTFLCQSSAVVYILCEESEVEYFKYLQGKQVQAKLILISSKRGKSFRLKMLTVEPNLKTTNLSETKTTETELVRPLQESVSEMLGKKSKKVSLENLAERARCCEILVDDDSDECRSALKNARKITARIDKISEFKDEELPTQGNIWKAISWVQTEHWRLRKVGKIKLEEYHKTLEREEKEFKKKQQRFEMTTTMSNFLNGLSASEVHRSYFLKWLEMTLEDLSRHQLSALLNQYVTLKMKCPKETDKIADVDQQISISSLQIKHFFRECGQRYTCMADVPEFSNLRRKVEQLPMFAAQMLLDGVPLELVDGDAANIPLTWINAVLTELHSLIQSNSKVKVISVIGVENSGKSTLLNTMFGTRFAVDKGMCTRGAFMQMITVSKHVKSKIGCDCIMLIDTEGLKAHKIVQDDHSHERDIEVACLAVALSDITIINISKDASVEKEFLRMVLNALTRVKVEDKKPLCHFVQVHMTGLPASDQKKRDKALLEQLNVMIQRDLQIKATKLADVVSYDSSTWIWHLPSVWRGTPPMASYSSDYSKTAQALKRCLLTDLSKCPERGDLMDFAKRIESYWESV
ncbi:up-regulator of cell proliferation-like [Poecilia formosa]|uniref:up-regulator of cell proliferation-like n=1 Tax=Poecilia formosa TaxID=48698 RepID=UPI0007B7AC47|nr:PREDICTED: up-regulator of cell proliferation-like [Poecilia formosa]